MRLKGPAPDEDHLYCGRLRSNGPNDRHRGSRVGGDCVGRAGSATRSTRPDYCRAGPRDSRRLGEHAVRLHAGRQYDLRGRISDRQPAIGHNPCRRDIDNGEFQFWTRSR
jgi:hypothetical protein